MYILVLGKPHRFTVLSDLMSELMEELDKLRAEAQQKETDLSISYTRLEINV